MRHVSAIVVALLVSFVSSAGVIRKFEPQAVDPGASAALFVGVRDFSLDDQLAPVPYAVDDAVDLAYQLALGSTPLVRPAHVALALSGEAQKEESRQRLARLIAAGAQTHDASASEILKLLETQSAAVRRNGILVASFATHGVSFDGVQYLLASSSLLQHATQTGVTDTEIRDIAAKNAGRRSLIFIDACRERLTRDSRNGQPDPRSTAAVMRAIGGLEGQVVLSAAAAGDYAYDDEVHRNGVFTEAVIDGIRCGAATDERGFVTVDTLSSFVEERVLSWIRQHRNATAGKATQLQSEGRTRTLPLCACTTDKASATPPRPR